MQVIVAGGGQSAPFGSTSPWGLGLVGAAFASDILTGIDGSDGDGLGDRSRGKGTNGRREGGWRGSRVSAGRQQDRDDDSDEPHAPH